MLLQKKLSKNLTHCKKKVMVMANTNCNSTYKVYTTDWSWTAV